MQVLLHENFYIVEALAGLIPIAAIMAHCYASAKKAERKHKALSEAIEYSHHLEAEELNRAETRKRAQAIMGRMRKAGAIREL